MSSTFSLERAGQWFLESGIQEPSGGVARYFDAQKGKNKPVSTEITGYTLSTLIYLHKITGEQRYLDRAKKTAQFLIEKVWDEAIEMFPFEYPSPSNLSQHHAYFFDTGIIIRGLLAVWRVTGDLDLFETARRAARAMISDFSAGGEFHPILQLPDKEPLDRGTKWSGSAGCYQLKAALAWWEVASVADDADLKQAFQKMLGLALQNHAKFLPGAAEPHRIMDRLHAYCYFLEGLTEVLDQPACGTALGQGIAAVEKHLRDIAPTFVRSDVYAQLLRLRIIAHTAGAASINREAAALEAAALAGFQSDDANVRSGGGLFFGRRNNAFVPHVNPVSTAFGLQAIELWRRLEAGEDAACGHLLI